MAASDHDVGVMNALISATIDSVQWLRAAADDLEDGTLKARLSDCADAREDVVLELQTRVRVLGGEPEDDGSFAQTAARAFRGLRDAVTPSNPPRLIAEVERDEDGLIGKFRTALDDARIEPASRAVIADAFSAIERDQNQIRTMNSVSDPATDKAMKAGELQ